MIYLLMLAVMWRFGKPLSHQAPHYAWEVIRTTDGVVLAREMGTGEPTLQFDLCSLFGEGWNLPQDRPRLMNLGPAGSQLGIPGGMATHRAATTYGCGTRGTEQQLWHTPLYVCPRQPRIPFLKCGDQEDYYCGQWGCETYAKWPPKLPDRDIRFTRQVRPGAPERNCTVGNCNPIVIKPVAYWAKDWTGGKTWGLRLYVSGPDPGVLFTIQRREIPRPPNPIGPLAPQRPEVRRPSPAPRVTSLLPPSSRTEASRRDAVTWPPPRGALLRPDIFTPLEASFQLLNKSAPDLTADCWLCLNPEPPYYVGIGASAPFGASMAHVRNVSADAETPGLCAWGKGRRGLTLGDITGAGLCVASANYSLPDSPYTENCNQTFRLPEKPGSGAPWYLVAPNGTWWACITGITPCILSLNLQTGPEPGLCVLTHILPQVYYYSGEGGREHLLIEPRRIKRAPVLVPLLVGLGIAGSTAVGTAALVTGHQNYKELGNQIDQDLSTLEKSIGQLEESVGSLAEVVLQNRRGLDLLFLKQGGLCLALGEACCFYTNHSGVIRESLSQLRKRLMDREEARRAEGNWYENLFSWSPWLTTLLSAVAGPLLLLIVGLIFGPCLLRCLLNFIQDRIQAVKLMVLHTQYSRILEEDTESKI